MELKSLEMQTQSPYNLWKDSTILILFSDVTIFIIKKLYYQFENR